MSVQAVAWVLDDLQGLKAGPSLVLLALADFADERNSCFPGRERIAGRARCSVRSVTTYLRELEELGLISIERRSYSTGKSQIRRSSNRYILHLDRTYPFEGAKFAASKETAGHNEGANFAASKTTPDTNEGAKFAASKETAGHNEGANFAASSFEGANSPSSKLQPVAHIEPPVIEPPDLSNPSIPLDGPGSSPEAVGVGLDGVGGFSSEVPSPVAGVVDAGASPDTPSRDVMAESEPSVGGSSAGSLVGQGQHELLVASVPSEFLSKLPTSAYAEFVDLIQQRLDAGMTTSQIFDILAGHPPSPNVRSMAGFLRNRFKTEIDPTVVVPAGLSKVRAEKLSRHHVVPEAPKWYPTRDGSQAAQTDNIRWSEVRWDWQAARQDGQAEAVEAATFKDWLSLVGCDDYVILEGKLQPVSSLDRRSVDLRAPELVRRLTPEEVPF